MKKRTLRSNQETDEGKRCAALANSLTKKAPYKGLGADSEEKHEPVSDIDTVVVDSLKALDPEWPIREADIDQIEIPQCSDLLPHRLPTREGGTPPASIQNNSGLLQGRAGFLMAG
jgi:hypothetical protein